MLPGGSRCILHYLGHVSCGFDRYYPDPAQPLVTARNNRNDADRDLPTNDFGGNYRCSAAAVGVSCCSELSHRARMLWCRLLTSDRLKYAPGAKC